MIFVDVLRDMTDSQAFQDVVQLSLTREQSSFLHCQLCSNVYQEPKQLDCYDTFCLRCIEQLATANQPYNKLVECPLCSKVTKLPVAGPQSLPTNGFMVKLMEIAQLEAEQKRQKLVCSACCRSSAVNAQQQLPTAVVYCVDCDDKLCVDCQQAHAKLKPTQSHQLFPLASDLLNTLHDVQKNKESMCAEHEVHQTTLYCKTCSKPICLMCAVLEHKTHDYTSISNVAADRAGELAAAVERLSAKLASLVCLRSVLEEKGKLLAENVSAMDNRVNSRSMDLKAHLQNGLKYLKVEVNNRQRDAMATVRKQEKPVRSKEAVLKAVAAFSLELARWGNDADICEVAPQLICRVSRMLAAVPSSVGQPINVEIRYSKPDTFGTLGKLFSDVFGTVSAAPDGHNCVAKNSNRLSCVQPPKNATRGRRPAERKKQAKQRRSVDKSVFSVQPSAESTGHTEVNSVSIDSDLEKVGSVKGTQPVYGIAVVGDELFVAYRSKSSVHVYNRQTLVFKRHLPVDGLVNPSDMSACEVNGNIYITEFTNNNIFCVAADGARSPKRQTIDRPCGISVAQNTNVCVAQSKLQCFAEFTADLQLIRVVKTPEFHPTHVVQLCEEHGDGERYVICERDYSSAVTLLRAQTKDSTTTAERIADTSQLMKAPSHLFIDAQRNIVVVDRRRHEIVVVNSSLTELRPARIDKNEIIYHPNKICIDSSGQTLYIGIDLYMVYPIVNVMAFRIAN